MTNWKPPKEKEPLNVIDIIGSIALSLFVISLAFLPAIIGEFL